MLNPFALALLEGGSDYNPMDPAGFGGFMWTWIIFLLALPLMWKFVMGPVTTALAQRDEQAFAAIESAEKAAQQAEKVRAEVEVKLGEAQASAAKMLSEARERAEKREHEIIELAKKEADTLRERAKADINSAKDQALAAIREQVVDISLDAASQILKRRVDAEDDRRLVSELVSAVSGGPEGA
jgi:F-type H+-transporting ATPase subunit b